MDPGSASNKCVREKERTSVSRRKKKDGVDATIVFGVVGDLSVFTPNHLTSGGGHAEFGNVDFDDGTFGQNTQLGVEGALRILLDTDDGQVERGLEFWVGDVRLVVTETHGTNETLELGWLSCEALSDKGGFGDHTLPPFLLALSGLDDLEGFVFGDTSHLGQGNRVAGGLVLSPLLDGGREGLCVLLTFTVEQVCGESLVGIGGCGSLLDISFLVRLERLFHLNLFVATLLVEHLGLETRDLLGHSRSLVHLTGGTLPLSLLMIESSTISANVLFDVIVLRRQVK